MKEDFEKTLETQEQPTSKIVLEFFRHGEKEKQQEGQPEYDIRLTPKGREQAKEKGKKIKPQPEVSLAIGSPRKRTQETAERIMLAEKEEITPGMSLEEIEKVINSEQKYGKKIITDPRLNFSLEGPVGKKIHENFKAGRLLPYLVYKSDKDAADLEDNQGSNWSKLAGNIAEIIQKYTKIAPNFDRLVNQKPEEYVQYKNQMERYLGTHQGITESFLAKVLEKTKGAEFKDEFVKSVGGGFKETEGVRIEIISSPDGQKIEVKYKMGDKEEMLELPQEVLEEIIKERNELNRKIEES